jgi:hypothetical protein
MESSLLQKQEKGAVKDINYKANHFFWDLSLKLSW